MTKAEVIFLLKRKILAQKLNMKIFLASYISMIFINLTIIKSYKCFIVIILLFPFIYFLLIPYFLKGFTPGGMIVGVKIVHINSPQEKIPFITYLKKLIYEFQFLFRKEKYSIFSKFPAIKYYLINSLGQLPFDEKLNLTTIPKEEKLSKNFDKTKVIYYEIEDLDKNFDLFGRKKIFIVQIILYLFWFTTILVTYHLTQILH